MWKGSMKNVSKVKVHKGEQILNALSLTEKKLNNGATRTIKRKNYNIEQRERR